MKDKLDLFSASLCLHLNTYNYNLSKFSTHSNVLDTFIKM